MIPIDNGIERAGHVLYDDLEEVREVLGRVVVIVRGPAVAADGVDYREVQLLVARPQLHEQREDLVQRGVRVAVQAVNLVYDDDGFEAQRQIPEIGKGRRYNHGFVPSAWRYGYL